MPLESAQFINGLIPTNPASTDPSGAADDHLRLIKGALKATFPAITGEVTASHTQLNQLADLIEDVTGLTENVNGLSSKLVPSGVILMWSGTADNIPTGWKLCDGSNGTPDLRDKFVLGASSTANPGSLGGASSATLTTTEAGGHTHTGVTGETTLTVAQMPKHTHGTAGTGSSGSTIRADGNSLGNTNNYLLQQGGAGGEFLSSEVGGGNPHTHPISNDGAHTHTGTVTIPRPPYMALCFIMKS